MRGACHDESSTRVTRTADASAGVLARNSLASILRTSSGAFLALLLPAVIIRQVGSTAYGVWALSVEIGTYLGLLDLGALSAVGHFVARVPDRDRRGEGQVVTTIMAIQGVMIAVGLLLLTALIVGLPAVYPRMPRPLIASGRVALGMVGGSALISLLPTTLTGYFLSIHQAVKPALIVFASRFLGSAIVTVLAIRGIGIAGLAMAWAATTLGGQVLIVVAFSRLRLPIRPSLLSWSLAREMIGFCGAYSIWIVAGLLVVGLDTTIVAWVNFGSVAAYAAAAGAVSIVGAVYSAALAPMVPLCARLAADGRRDALGTLFLRLVRLGGLAVILSSCVFAVGARPLLHVWVGAESAERGTRILQLLVAANALRLLILPYPMLLFATGEHRQIWATPLLEGIVNVGASIALGVAFGPVGVALGTLVGAVVGVGCHIFVNLPRTQSVDVKASDLLKRSILGPLVGALPIVLVLFLPQSLPPHWKVVWSATSLVLAGAFMWRMVVAKDERQAVRARCRTLSSRASVMSRDAEGRAGRPTA